MTLKYIIMYFYFADYPVRLAYLMVVDDTVTLTASTLHYLYTSIFHVTKSILNIQHIHYLSSFFVNIVLL